MGEFLGSDYVRVHACFYLEPGDIQYPSEGDGYAEVLDADGNQLDHMAMPQEAKDWIINGLGKKLWFYDTAYAPDASLVDLYLKGHSTEHFVRVGSTGIPGTYQSGSFFYTPVAPPQPNHRPDDFMTAR
jgi:hypothetical protein